MRFENKKPGHYKYYEVNMLETPIENIWIVLAESGTINTRNPRRYEKARGSFEECQNVFTKIIKKRIKNGYTKVK